MASKRINYKIINQNKLKLVRLADSALNLMGFTGLIQPEKSPESLVEAASNIKKLLVVRLAYLGDIVMTLPVLPPLRRAFPAAEIHILTSTLAAPLLAGNPDIDGVITHDPNWFYSKGTSTSDLVRRLRRESFDAGFDFRGDIRNIYHCLFRPGIPVRISYESGGGGKLLTHPVPWDTLKHKVEYHLDILRYFGFDAPYSAPRIFLSSQEIAEAEERLMALTGSKVASVVVHPGSRLPLKRWRPERFSRLIRDIQGQHHIQVILMCGPGEAHILLEIIQQTPGVKVLENTRNIRQFAAVMSRTQCLVCHDSAPMHIAAACGAKVVALFGPSRPVETAPCGEHHEVLEGFCPSKDECDENRCITAGNAACINDITIERVLAAVKRVLGLN